MSCQISVSLCQVPEVVCLIAPEEVVVLVEQGGNAFDPGARTIDFNTVDRAVKQSDNFWTILCDASGGDFKGAKAIVFSTVGLVSKVRVTFRKIDASIHEVDVVDENAIVMTRLSQDTQSADVEFSGGVVAPL